MSANENHTPNALPAGYRFNEFEIKEVIGGGGFGIVYRAWDHQLERTIAIKEYMPVSLAVRGADLALEIQHVQVMNAAVVLVSAVVTANFLIAAGAEGFVASTG